MNLPFFIGQLFILALLFLWVGKRYSTNTQNKEDYVTGGRCLRFWPLTLTFLATQIGGGVILGSADEAYSRGWSVLCYPLGSCLGMILLALGFGARLQKLRLKTIAELLELRYNSPALRLTASLVLTASLFFILVAQSIAAREFFATLGVGTIGFLFFWGLMVLYTSVGGLQRVAYTAVVQSLFMMAALLVAFIIALQNGFITLATTTSPKITTTAAPWLEWLIMPSLFMLIEQDMAQGCFAASSSKTVSRAAATAAILFFFVCAIPISFGIAASQQQVSPPLGQSVFLASLTAFTNPIISALGAATLLMAVVSTADSLLAAISAQITCDLPLLSSGGVRLTKAVTLIVGLAAAALSLFWSSVVSTVIFSYELSISVLFVPIILAMTQRSNRNGIILAMTCGALSYFTFRLFPLPFPSALAAIALSAVAGGFAPCTPTKEAKPLWKPL